MKISFQDQNYEVPSIHVTLEHELTWSEMQAEKCSVCLIRSQEILREDYVNDWVSEFDCQFL